MKIDLKCNAKPSLERLKANVTGRGKASREGRNLSCEF